MFGKEKKKSIIVNTDFDYTKWKEDLGFLELIMTRKQNLIKNFDLNLYSDQLGKTDYIKDREIEDTIVEAINDVNETISDAYREFLVRKYFKDNDALITYISEEMTSSIRAISVDLNNNKIIKIARSQNLKKITAKNNEKEGEGNETDK